jgi:murein DD-endopeptidase MepM/ murein hydrolase activator NlpD
MGFVGTQKSQIAQVLSLCLLWGCATLEERQPPWRKNIPLEESAEEFEDYDRENIPFKKEELYSKLPPVELDWPIETPEVTAFFGWRRKKMHEGLDLRASQGTPVFASATGVVIYASRRIKGFGNMVIIDHGEGWSTLYAHLKKMFVREGDKVTQGEQIGLSGKTGRTRGPHLHFELRRGADPVDPLLFMPILDQRD